MSKKSKREYFRQIYPRYRVADAQEKSRILNEFCEVCGYNRKYAIAKLNAPAPEKEGSSSKKKRHRVNLYSHAVIAILYTVWVAAGYICSIRLKAALRLWLPWIRERFRMSETVEKSLLSISARQIDRRLQDRKRQLRRSIYGRTKPGALLKHQIPIKTDNWNVKTAGFTEVDLVSHSGSSAAGEFRLIESGEGHPDRIAGLQQLRESRNPFDLAKTIETKLYRIHKLAARSRISTGNNTTRQKSPKTTTTNSTEHLTNTVASNNQPVRFPAVSKPKPQSSESSWHSPGSLLEANFK